MNQIGFHALHRYKTPTERLEELKHKVDQKAENICAVSFPVFSEDELYLEEYKKDDGGV